MANFSQINTSPVKPKKPTKPSNLVKALIEVVNEFVAAEKNKQSEMKARYVLLFTSKFSIEEASRDEIRKLCFYLHSLSINLLIFGYEIGDSPKSE